ncbi:MAG: hypothetical protein Q7T55_25840 [Solirubrobacteraceae bacterium]|nr:hypothetical protein [Solirubrobacteraceae bacterium]
MLPSSRFPFLSVASDGKQRDKHSRLVLFVFGALRAAGCKDLNIHHVAEGGLDGDLPLVKAGKWYDLAFVDEDDEVVLVEIMRTYRKVNRGKNPPL